jgi:hypothetical protein
MIESPSSAVKRTSIVSHRNQFLLKSCRMEPLCEVNCVDNHPQYSAISASENRALIGSDLKSGFGSTLQGKIVHGGIFMPAKKKAKKKKKH